MHGQDDIEQLHRVAGERMNSTFCRFSFLRNAISLFVKIRFSGTEETPLQAVNRLFFEEKKRVTDIVSVHRRVAPGDPIGRFEETERAARFQVGFFEESRRPDAEGGGQGVYGARENGLFIDQMIIRGLADSRALQEGVEGQTARAAQFLGVLPGKAHVQMVLYNSTVVKLVLDSRMQSSLQARALG
jgi:hypothetical protein